MPLTSLECFPSAAFKLRRHKIHRASFNWHEIHTAASFCQNGDRIAALKGQTTTKGKKQQRSEKPKVSVPSNFNAGKPVISMGEEGELRRKDRLFR